MAQLKSTNPRVPHQAEQILLHVWLTSAHNPAGIFLGRQFMDQLCKLLTLFHQVCGCWRRGAAGSEQLDLGKMGVMMLKKEKCFEQHPGCAPQVLWRILED